MTDFPMLQKSLFALFMVLLACAASPAVAAEAEITECGVPSQAQLNTDAMAYCDIHGRRLAYSDEDKKFRDLIEQRRKNYAAPGIKAINQHKDDLKARYDAHTPASAAGPAAESEQAGPAVPNGLNP